MARPRPGTLRSRPCPRRVRTPINPHTSGGVAPSGRLVQLPHQPRNLLPADVAQPTARPTCVASRRSTDPDRRLSPSTITARIRITQSCPLQRDPDRQYRPGSPVGRRTPRRGRQHRTGGNSSHPCPTPCSARCWRTAFTAGDVGPHLAVEASAARGADQREAGSRRYLPQSESACCGTSSKTAAPPGSRRPTGGFGLGPAATVGWDRRPLLHLAWHPIVVPRPGDRETP